MSSNLLDRITQAVEVVGHKGSTLIARCPVCLGTNLKINTSPTSKTYGAYRCWDNYCDPKEIKKLLGLSEGFVFESIFSPSTLFQDQSGLLPEKPSSFLIKEKDFCKVRSDYQPPVLINLKPLKQISYYYSPFQRMLRLNGEKKMLFLQVWTPENGWFSGTGQSLWPLYSNGCNLDNKTIVMVEGEKTTEAVKRTGLACVTSCAAFFDTNNLYVNFLRLKKNSNIENIIYIPDDDEAGYKKAKEVSLACQKANLGYIQKSIKNLNLKNKSGFDLADIDDLQLIYDFILND
jgi:hypothetical protein